MRRTRDFLQVMQLISRAIRMFTPWVVRLVSFVLGLIATAVVGFWGNVPQMATRMADRWLDRAVAAGFPTEWDLPLYRVLWVASLLTLVVGWIILAFITVWIVTSIL